MSLVPDHNAARWLIVKYLDDDLGGGGTERREGWHVVRICPCHFGHSVTIPLPSEKDAERARDAMLSVAA